MPRPSDFDIQFWRYCGKDAAVTFEINQVQESKLKPKQKEHYQFNLNLLAPLLYMELRGIRYDHEKAKQKLARVQRAIFRLQDLLNRVANVAVGTISRDSRSYLDAIKAKCCIEHPRRVKVWQEEKVYKNGRKKLITRRESLPVAITSIQDCFEFARAGMSDTLQNVQRILEADNFGPRTRGELSILLGSNIKVNATGAGKDAQTFLYETVGFPKQFKKEQNKLTDKLATDDEAIIKILVQAERRPIPFVGPVRLRNRARIALAFLRLRRLITESKTLSADCDFDGRIRCGYNLVKSSGSGGPTKTGRLACYESPTGSGFNLQTVTKKHRDLFQADEGCLLGQRDLSGADGWTVAAFAAMLGDSTMLEDYRAGLKPAKIGVLMWKLGASVNQLDRAKLKELCKQVDGDGWEYFGFKRVQHGSSYMMGERTMSNQILTDSWKITGKPVVVPEGVCKQMQMTCFFARYRGVPMWHRWMAVELMEKGSLTASNGFTRKFFGRKDDHKTIKEALAHLPQVYTTYATECALLRLWLDADNRLDEHFRVEPLHTVHDSLLDSFAETDKDFAEAKHQEWFNNPLNIAGFEIVIPAEGGVGKDWKNLAN